MQAEGRDRYIFTVLLMFSIALSDTKKPDSEALYRNVGEHNETALVAPGVSRNPAASRLFMELACVLCC